MRHALDCATSCGMRECDCGVTGIYRVLDPAPITEKTGQVTYTAEGPIHWHRVIGWKHRGYANSYEDARRLFGGRPVLELIGRLQ